MRRRILSIDGGGVRGVIPAVALAELERAVGGHARDHFDFVAGTSTGALIAAALAAGIPARSIVDLYVERAPPLFRKVPVLSTLRRIVFGHMYDVHELHRLIRQELGGVAANWTVNDVPCDILVTAKGLAGGHQWYFVKDKPNSNSCRTGGLSLADCLTASAAAPTLFAPWAMRGIDGLLVDGGTGVAGNPVYQACVEAFHYADGYRPAETIIVSLGTGHFFERPMPRWLHSWVGWLIAELLRSPGEQQTELVDRHFSRAAFFRIDARLPRDFSIDDPRQIGELLAIGERLAAGIDWPRILDGTSASWRVTRDTRRPVAYARTV